MFTKYQIFFHSYTNFTLCHLLVLRIRKLIFTNYRVSLYFSVYVSFCIFFVCLIVSLFIHLLVYAILSSSPLSIDGLLWTCCPCLFVNAVIMAARNKKAELYTVIVYKKAELYTSRALECGSVA